MGFNLEETPPADKATADKSRAAVVERSENVIETFDEESTSASTSTSAAAAASAAKMSPSKDSESPHVHTVSEINSLIRQMLEGEFNHIWLRAEISNFKAHTSGHFYFSLKDENAQISAVMFKGLNSKLKFRPENGLEVIIRGKVTVYEVRGNYQIFCEYMEPVGAGALQKAYEQLKAKLQTEGLFDLKRKRAIPQFPKHIGLVTSPTGAAIQDILNVLRRRYRSARITLAPALVQGDPAPASIVSAIQLINKVSDVDVIIVGRGGGSIEDLWAFNDERVARAIAASRIPTISAVGHEVDFTIADFVADLRAPTPSAAAELVVKSATEIEEKIQSLKTRLWQGFSSNFRRVSDEVRSLSKRLVDPQRKLQDLQIRCDELSTRLESAVFRYIEDQRMTVELALKKLGSPREMLVKLLKRLQLAEMSLRNSIVKNIEKSSSLLRQSAGRLDAMSPLRVVERGYSIVEKLSGVKKIIVKSSGDVVPGEQLNITLAQGGLTVEVKSIHK
ncbi:MAG: exodeoxyribonuclease VII large subunit [Bdellovibrionales bacterium]|nr:exodeoxyribonuclease VII large subunit [Bdellovibrionales bacterium]